MQAVVSTQTFSYTRAGRGAARKRCLWQKQRPQRLGRNLVFASKAEQKTLVPTRGGGVCPLLRYPKFFVRCSLHRILTAATRSVPFIRHRRRSHRSPTIFFIQCFWEPAKSIGRRRLLAVSKLFIPLRGILFCSPRKVCKRRRIGEGFLQRRPPLYTPPPKTETRSYHKNCQQCSTERSLPCNSTHVPLTVHSFLSLAVL